MKNTQQIENKVNGYIALATELDNALREYDGDNTEY